MAKEKEQQLSKWAWEGLALLTNASNESVQHKSDNTYYRCVLFIGKIVASTGQYARGNNKNVRATTFSVFTREWATRLLPYDVVLS